MIRHHLLRRYSAVSRSPAVSARSPGFSQFLPKPNLLYSTTATEVESPRNRKEGDTVGKWYTLPTYTHSVNPSALGKELSGSSSAAGDLTAIKWVLRCCPHLPRSLVQKLFRLRQVILPPFPTTAKKIIFKFLLTFFSQLYF